MRMPVSTSVHRGGQPRASGAVKDQPGRTVLTLFGTRPELIKLAPILLQLERQALSIRTTNVSSGQHVELLDPLIAMFGVRIDFDLQLMTANQNPAALLRRIIQAATPIMVRENPDLVVVQGDTTTALAGAIAARRQGVPVAHVEAGLRSGDLLSPYPEEMNRRFITRLATYHFAATERNRDSLRQEGINEAAIFVTGNPVVDALQMVLRAAPSAHAVEILRKIAGRKCIVLTTHRRESFGPFLKANLEAIRIFVQKHSDVVVLFPVHPNPHVKVLAYDVLGECPRILLTSPMAYPDFVYLLSKSWLIVSDSGGIQEEVASLGKPLLILRENTERPECVEAGFARLVGRGPESLLAMLEEAYQAHSWLDSVKKAPNPFGTGDSANGIVNRICALLQQSGTANYPWPHGSATPRSHRIPDRFCIAQ